MLNVVSFLLKWFCNCTWYSVMPWVNYLFPWLFKWKYTIIPVCVVAFSDWMLTAFLSQGLGMVVLYPWSYGPSSFPGFLYGRVIWTHDSVFELDIPWSYSPSSFPDSLYMYSGTVSLIPWSQFFPWSCLVELSCFMILFFLWLFVWWFCIPWPHSHSSFPDSFSDQMIPKFSPGYACGGFPWSLSSHTP